MLLVLIGIVEPFPSILVNRLEMYNNWTVILLSYCLLCFTPWVSDAGRRYQIGYGMIILTGQNILVNLAIMSYDPVRMLKLRFKKSWKLRHDNQKKIQ